MSKRVARRNVSPAERKRRSEHMKNVRKDIPKKSDPGGEEFHKKAADARKLAREEKEITTKIIRYLKAQLTDENIEAFTAKMWELAIADPNSRCGQTVLDMIVAKENFLDQLHTLQMIDEHENEPSKQEVSPEEGW